MASAGLVGGLSTYLRAVMTAPSSLAFGVAKPKARSGKAALTLFREGARKHEVNGVWPTTIAARPRPATDRGLDDSAPLRISRQLAGVMESWRVARTA